MAAETALPPAVPGRDTGGRLWPLVIAALLLTVAAGAMPLIGRSPITIAAASAAAAPAVYLIRRPLAALNVCLGVMLVPDGLLPGALQSALVLLTVGLAWGAWLRARPTATRAPWPLPLLLLGAFLLWSFMTLAWAADLVSARHVLVQYTLVISVTFLALRQIRTLQAVDQLMGTLAFVAWLLVGCAIYALLTRGYSAGVRFTVLDVNANLFGFLLVLLTPGVLWRVLRQQGSRPGPVAASIAYLLISLVIIALSGSRGSLLAFVLMLIAFAVTRSTRRWAGLTALLTAGLLVAAPLVFSTVTARFENPQAELSRGTLWASSTALLIDHPWGLGVGNGASGMLPYIEQRVDGDLVGHRTEYPAHDPLLEVGTDSGFVGVALYAGAVLTAVWLFVRSAVQARRRRDRLTLAYLAVVGDMALAFGAGWVKSGGVAGHPSTFLVLVLLVLPSLLTGPGGDGEESAPS